MANLFRKGRRRLIVDHLRSTFRTTPRWVWLIVVALSSVEPLTHVWILYFLPETSAPSGFHIADSTVFLHSMRMFTTDFHTPFASCESPLGDNSPWYFAATFHWMYGVVGWIGSLLRAPELVTLGVANGLGLAFCLLTGYLLIRELDPKAANTAFLLFALGGGLGGALYWAAGVAGLYDSAQFEAHFMRFAVYELIEGPNFSPLLWAPRLYYTISLGLCWLALCAFVRGAHVGSRRWLALSMVTIFFASLVNMRFGVPAAFVALLYLHGENVRARMVRLRMGAYFLAPALSGAALAYSLMAQRPAFVENSTNLVTASMWLTPFVSAAFFHIVVMPREAWRSIVRGPRFVVYGGFAALAYLGAFVVLFLAAVLYYGAGFDFWDHGAAAKVSDCALLAVPVGLFLAWRRLRHFRAWEGATPIQGWITLWFLLFVVLALGAFGGGAYSRLAPSRLMPLIAMPLALVTASALYRMYEKSPPRGSFFTALIVLCGVFSNVVAALAFQGPLGLTPGEGPFHWVHAEATAPEDRALLDRIDEGVVLAPADGRMALLGDFAALKPGVNAVFAYGNLDLSDKDFFEVQKKTLAFFTPGADASERRRFVQEYCIDYVLCPDTRPVDPDVVSELEQLDWLTVVDRQGRGVLFAARK